MISQSEIECIITPILENHDAFLVDFVQKRRHGDRIIEFYVDSDEGITVQKCTQISRDISVALSKVEDFYSNYTLVVSSPGLDRPLKFFRQYPRNIGRKLSVQYQSDKNVEKIVGELICANDGRITLRLTNGDECLINFDSIQKAYVLPEW